MTQTGSISGSISQGMGLLSVPKQTFAAADWSPSGGVYTLELDGRHPMGVFRTATGAAPEEVLCGCAVAAAGVVLTAPAPFAGYAYVL